MDKKILVIGSNGLLGTAFRNKIKPTKRFMGDKWIFGVHKEESKIEKDDVVFDILKPEEYCHILKDVDILINCVGYTNVDEAEDNEMNYMLNEYAVLALAERCKENNVYLIHFSTDYIYDGENNKGDFDDYTIYEPVNEYGKAKLNGEIAIKESGCDYLIMRISWLYAEYGKNFVNTIYELLKKNVPQIKVVSNIMSSLTNVYSVVDKIRYFVKSDSYLRNKCKTVQYHSNYVTTPYRLALRLKKSLTDCTTTIIPVLSEEYGFKAKRPKTTVMDLTSFHNNFYYETDTVNIESFLIRKQL